MPTSPKTAKEILGEFDEKFLPSDDVWSLETVDDVRAFLLSAMRAAVEAVRPQESVVSEPDDEYAKVYNLAIKKFDANVSRFFNDDPTSPPTPRN